MSKGALAAAVLFAAGAAGAWWFLARSDASDGALPGRAPAASPRAEVVPAESAAAPALDAIRTENRGLASPRSGAERSAEAYASGATNWDQTAKTSGIELDVIDATTRERLHGVTVEQGGENYESATSREPPGGGPHALEIAADAERVPVAKGDAPLRIQLPPKMRRGRIRYLIGAPGHETVARWFDVSISGWRRHVVALGAGGSLVVVVRGGGVSQRGKVELFDDFRLMQRLLGRTKSGRGGPSILPSLFDDAEDAARLVRAVGADVSFAFETTPGAAQVERRVEALPCGHWLGLATFGDGASILRHAVATAFVDEEAEDGGAARMEFDLSGAPPPPPVVRIAGTIRFAPGWTAAEVASVHSLTFTALDIDPLCAPLDCSSTYAVPTEDDHRLAFDAPWPTEGRHVMALEGIAAAFAIDVGTTTGEPTSADPSAKGAARPIELLVDEPATVTLSAHDRSGAPRALVLLRYFAGREVGRYEWTESRIATRPDGTAPPVRVPRGPFHVETEPRASVSFVACSVDLVAGEHAIDLVVGEYAGIRLSLRDGDVPLPWTSGTGIEVARADDPRHPLDVSRRSTLSGPGLQIDVEAPCRYVVAVRGVPGFEDPAPVEVDVAPGQIAAVEFVLTTPR